MTRCRRWWMRCLFAQHTYVRLTQWSDECLVRCVMPTVLIFCAFCGIRMDAMQWATVSRFGWRAINEIKGRLKPPKRFVYVCMHISCIFESWICIRDGNSNLCVCVCVLVINSEMISAIVRSANMRSILGPRDYSVRGNVIVSRKKWLIRWGALFEFTAAHIIKIRNYWHDSHSAFSDANL